tara:strand:- start:79 stop:903 length:825 start_codon:yes stop_codon:yes gene_type:complete
MIFDKIINEFYINKIKKYENISVTFSGGLGNQILSLLAYKYLQQSGRNISADLSYFEDKNYQEKLKKKNLSVFNWELDKYADIKLKDFSKPRNKYRKSLFTIKDGYAKLFFSLQSSKNSDLIESIGFVDSNTYLPNHISGLEKYICVHIRKGDYLKVASHLIKSQELINIAIKFSNVIENLVILSDGNLESHVQYELNRSSFKNINILVGGDPTVAHSIMRSSKLLICTNSQFSLSAGIIEKMPILLPKKWYGFGKNYFLELLIQENGSGFFLN